MSRQHGNLLTRNRIFMDRMQGTGIIDKATAINYGITGPFLRASGVALTIVSRLGVTWKANSPKSNFCNYG